MVRAVAFSPDSAILEPAAPTARSRLWDVRPAAPISLGQVGQHARPVTCLAFAPDGRFVLAGSANGGSEIWPATSSPTAGPTGQQGRTLGDQGSALTCLAISPDGRTALSGRGGTSSARVVP